MAGKINVDIDKIKEIIGKCANARAIIEQLVPGFGTEEFWLPKPDEGESFKIANGRILLERRSIGPYAGKGWYIGHMVSTVTPDGLTKMLKLKWSVKTDTSGAQVLLCELAKDSKEEE